MKQQSKPPPYVVIRITPDELFELDQRRAGTHALVPVEPTDKLVAEIFWKVWPEYHHDAWEVTQDAYRAMIAAAQEEG